MNIVSNTSQERRQIFSQRYGKYVLVLVVFGVYIFYNFVVVKNVSRVTSPISSQLVGVPTWDITTDVPQKKFVGVLQGRPGDWYRIGVLTRAKHDSSVDVFIGSQFGQEGVRIGSFDVSGSDDDRYQEIRFPVPNGLYSDITLVLRDETKTGEWPFTGVQLSKFDVSRLDVKTQAEADRLAPTLVGMPSHETILLSSDRDDTDPNSIFKAEFVAKDDFLDHVMIHLKDPSMANGSVLELRQKVSGSGNESDVSIKKSVLTTADVESYQDDRGNQLISFPAYVEQGKSYVITLTGDPNITLSPIGNDMAGMISDDAKPVGLVFGRHAVAFGDILLLGATVEDLGTEGIYSYSMNGTVDDYFNLFGSFGSVRFDEKGKLIVGKQMQGTSFTYRFFTVNPFRKFMLVARQAGNRNDQIRLAYSLDNATWQDVPSSQMENKPMDYTLSLPGDGTERIVYIRATYTGKDKKTETFGLDRLSVRAELIRK